MFRPDDPQRYWRHLREGLPMVLALLLLTGLEILLDSILHFGATPLSYVLPHAPATLIWEALLYLLGVAALLLYLADRTTSIRAWSMVCVAVFTSNLLSNVYELVLARPDRIGSDGWALLTDGLIIWLSNVLVFSVGYWLVDGGGYVPRAQNKPPPRDFLFPPPANPPPGNPQRRPPHLHHP